MRTTPGTSPNAYTPLNKAVDFLAKQRFEIIRITDFTSAEEVRRRLTDYLEENPDVTAVISGVNNLGLTLRTSIELLGKRPGGYRYCRFRHPIRCDE